MHCTSWQARTDHFAARIISPGRAARTNKNFSAQFYQRDSKNNKLSRGNVVIYAAYAKTYTQSSTITARLV